MYLNSVKEIAADILYLDDVSELDDNQPLGEHGFSSIDYIDLCFEIKNQVSNRVSPENLWPINAMATQQEFFDGGTWTKAGWDKVVSMLKLGAAANPIAPAELVQFFTPQVISNRISQIVNS